MAKRFRYSAWDGTQVVDDLDADDLLAEIADDVITHGDLTAALRRLIQQGFSPSDAPDVEGLRELMQRLRDRRQEMLERYDPDGVIERIRERLDEIVRTETDTVERTLRDTPDPHAQQPLLDRLEQLHRMPPDPGRQISELRNDDFVDPGAQQAFDDLMEELREQAMQQYTSQLTDGMRNMSPESMQRMKDMMAGLNEMLRRREAGEDPGFDDFMRDFGDFFPENPRNLDELLAQMAQRMLQTQMLLNSMSPEQRAELQSVMDAMMEDLDLSWQAAELGRNLANAFPTLPWDQGFDFSGAEGMQSMGQGMSLMEALGQMSDLESFMGQATNPNMLAEIDPEQVGDLLGADAEQSLRRLQEITRRLQEAGLIDNVDGSFELTPKGMRKIGNKTLGELFSKLQWDRTGEHHLRRRGQLGEPTYQSRPYEFGDPFLLDVNATIRNAMRRAGPGTPVRISPDDFEIAETERMTRTATVLLLDLSLSMVMRDNFLAAKKVAVALHTLIASKFPRDDLGIIGFGEVAREIAPEDLPKASYDFAYGTNMQHAFMLARRFLGRTRATTRQILMITDGEPTAHLVNGYPEFMYPPSRETVEETLKEVVRCTREQITINTFMLDATPALKHFVERMTQMNGGRAFFTTPETLGEFVLVDFLEHRRRQRRA